MASRPAAGWPPADNRVMSTAMNSPFAIALIVFAGASGGALAGMLLARVLPADHLSEGTRETVRLGVGVVATMTALVLGFLVSSASATLERTSTDLAELAGKAVLLDRALANYGPEAAPLRTTVRTLYASELASLLSGDVQSQMQLTTLDAISRVEALPRELRALAPRDDTQQAYREQALTVADELSADRWLLLFHGWNAIPIPLLAALVFWLAATFGFFGLFAPRNLTVVVVLVVCAASAAIAVFLIDEMNTPFGGWIRVPPEPLQQALVHLGE
jgi:hypothetical protein